MKYRLVKNQELQFLMKKFPTMKSTVPEYHNNDIKQPYIDENFRFGWAVHTPLWENDYSWVIKEVDYKKAYGKIVKIL